MRLPQHGGTHPIEPDFPSFSHQYEEGVPQVAWTRLVADLETPVSAMLKLAHERPNSFLFESVEGGATRGRYSIIGCEPDLIWRADGAKAEINRAPQVDPNAFAPSPLPTLTSLRALLAESAIALPAELPPMAAGIFGYMGYDTVRLIEHLPEQKPDSLGLPDSILVRPKLILRPPILSPEPPPRRTRIWLKSSAPRITLPPAISFRWCSASASRRPS